MKDSQEAALGSWFWWLGLLRWLVCAEGGFSLAGPNQGHLELALVGKGHLQHNYT